MHRKINREQKVGVTLSVCMIVKDEQDYLGACLQSIKGIADEIVVVDTGSSDRTVEIARNFNAKILYYEWKDDFADARNYGIEQATGDWVLIIDADEIISEKDRYQFAEFCGRLPLDEDIAYSMTTLNYTDQKDAAGWVKDDNRYPEAQGYGWVPTEKVRLFPNRAHIRFVYPVHEMVDPVLSARKYHVHQCPVPVLHFGKLNQNRKHERWQTYYRIGKKKLGALGDHDAALRELAIQAALLNHLDEASDLWKRYLGQRPESITGWTNLASVYARLKRYPEASEAALRAAEIAPDKLEPLYNLVISDLQKGDAAQAGRDAHRLLEAFPDYPQGQMLAAISKICDGQWETGIRKLKRERQKADGRVFRQMIIEICAPLKQAGYHDWIKHICNAIEQVG